MNAVGQHPVPAMGTGTQSCLQPVGEGAGLQEEAPGVAVPVLGPPPSPGPVCVWIRSSWSPEKQTQGHGSPLTATGSGWRMQFLGVVAAGKEGIVALGALGQDWTQRDLYPPPTPALLVPFGAPALSGLPPPASFGPFCSESDARLPAGAMCTVTPR